MISNKFGFLVAMHLLGVQAAAAQDTGVEGERRFNTRCASCHGVQTGQNRVGPNLAEVMGRQAGSLQGARYS